jgi:acyl dehydratase
MLGYEVVAHNTATASLNRIHDDEVARRYGFSGGLVPGVDVYAYMTRVPAEAWGTDWLARGTMRARFLSPVYEGEALRVVPGVPVESPAGVTVGLELRNAAGETCAVGEAGLPAAPPAPPAPAPAPVAGVIWPVVAPAVKRPEAAPDVLAPGTPLAIAPHRFVADRAGEYLAEVRETLPLYAAARVAHPGWLLRDANYVLSSNVLLGPWIHVESVTVHHATVGDGDTVVARATVTREWERKGHRFVALDVGLLVQDGDGSDGSDRSSARERLVARVAHTAIYRPRAAVPSAP